MGTIGNEALENIRNEMKGVKMASNMVNLNIDIPADKKEIITAFKGLINAFKSDIKVKEIVEVSQESNKTDMSKILAYAGIGKPKLDIPDDINIKDIKLNDKQYLAKRYGV